MADASRKAVSPGAASFRAPHSLMWPRRTVAHELRSRHTLRFAPCWSGGAIPRPSECSNGLLRARGDRAAPRGLEDPVCIRVRLGKRMPASGSGPRLVWSRSHGCVRSAAGREDPRSRKARLAGGRGWGIECPSAVRLFRGPAFRGLVSAPGAYFTRWQRVQDAAHRELAPASSSPVVALTILNCSAWNAGSARKESLPK